MKVSERFLSELHLKWLEFVELQSSVVAVNGQLLPRTLQAWHETSASLLRNQTEIQDKLAEMQNSLKYLWSNFSSYCLFEKSEGKHEDDQKLVADFGAKIEAMFSDLDNVREHYDSINKQRIDLQQLIEELKVGCGREVERIVQVHFNPKA